MAELAAPQQRVNSFNSSRMFPEHPARAVNLRRLRRQAQPQLTNRAEMLGIGVWANKKAKPRRPVLELGNRLAAVVLPSERSEEMCRGARDLAGKFGEADGRETAARGILKGGRLDGQRRYERLCGGERALGIGVSVASAMRLVVRQHCG